MSLEGGKVGNHRFHGDPERFAVVAHYIAGEFGKRVTYIADIAGGQGMLTRILRKKYNYDAEVIDPRGFRLKGVPGKEEEFNSKIADYYDLLVGLHPDEALKETLEAGKIRPTILIPCCNFLTTEKKLSQKELLEEIENYYKENKITYKRITFDFRGPKNIGFVTMI